jgi:hypothetical protein
VHGAGTRARTFERTVAVPLYYKGIAAHQTIDLVVGRRFVVE